MNTNAVRLEAADNHIICSHVIKTYELRLRHKHLEFLPINTVISGPQSQGAKEPIEARPHHRKQKEGDLDSKKLRVGEEKKELSKNFENGLVYIPRRRIMFRKFVVPFRIHKFGALLCVLRERI